VQCEGSVRDPIRLAALGQVNQVGRPSGLGIELEALWCPTGGADQLYGGNEEENGGESPDFE